MKHIGKVIVLTATLGLAACSNPDRFGAGGADGMGTDPYGAGAGAGMGQVTSGALDPTTPAYFNQTIGDRVLFAVDTSTLSPQARETLTAQSNWLMQNPEFTAIVEGHADEQGTREYNLALGERRANAVQDFLIAQGVPSTRLRTVSYGKERPIEVCSDEACYAKNRRAVTVVAAGGLTS
ncbi:peptidoglycan-associated lipoprotein Pal [Mesobaculum littorinae]|uniref:Peptidoglycan-associated lipoprotein n=1 Tax=Mesobaculum littorinae TaxID=2486419 RepID=A0A438AIJ3_9RHOB|nr:peptidoglycan-associated lipoprotein Pal [Mesobaculum littorinae]RVV98502.1 peptidoglycan-associated lipoprotein Pal [Mesobaculum littorinae]